MFAEVHKLNRAKKRLPAEEISSYPLQENNGPSLTGFVRATKNCL